MLFSALTYDPTKLYEITLGKNLQRSLACSEPAHRSQLGSLLPYFSRVSFSHDAARTVHARHGHELRRLVGSGVAPPSSAQQACCRLLSEAAELQLRCRSLVQRWRRHLLQPRYSLINPSNSPRQQAHSSRRCKRGAAGRLWRPWSPCNPCTQVAERDVAVLPDGATRASQRDKGEAPLRPCAG